MHKTIKLTFKIVLTLCFWGISSLYVSAQQWTLGGNNVVKCSNATFGTINNTCDIKFITSNIERLRLTKDGNFGVGTNSPLRLFHVNGDIRFENLPTGMQNTALMIDANGDLSTRNLSIDNWNTAFSWGNHAEAGYISNPNDADADPNNELQNLSINNNTLELENGGSVSLDNLNYWTKNENNTLYYDSYNVGIGISTPQSDLHIHNEKDPYSIEHNSEIQIEKISHLVRSLSRLQLTNASSGTSSSDGLQIGLFDNNAFITNKENGHLTLSNKPKGLQLQLNKNGDINIGTFVKKYVTVAANGKVGIGTSQIPDLDYLTELIINM